MDQNSCNQHMQSADHFSDRYCRECKKYFQNAHNLRQHLNSRTHRGSDVKCPFCNTGFVTPSGASHHLETGSCPGAPRLNRESIARVVQRLDTTGVIAKKQIEWHEQNVEYVANSSSWNGSGYECYLCHRNYRTLLALNQHLKSPAHAQKVYHCPNRGCAKEFTALAALFNHLESESCRFMRFENVQRVHRQLTDQITSNRRITLF
ncbi:unnamed protein product [Penicillium salamii]|uniref:C2H2-type domain-containing protein n=1 Tax=Penicillium salamii TaxID=1612424 RepID=A0A9W4NIB2_9EURO|nr:unnamed protein product [Penicillium salamii]CAG7970254.1 unnamed protein product [Penicillium salamii]CAG8092118.1 unnamed protein product [Penicillium salamii]CAG8094227.1 unnamed protein product [Penicillium salamii]CAG8300971.1 unnamed protein product [Penicillium salamii]